MAEIRLRRVLSRYSKGDLQRVLKELGVEGESTYKRQLVAAAVAQLVKTNVTPRDITQLELQYILAHPNAVSWTSYKLHPVNDLCTASLDNHAFLKKFQLYLGDVCKYDLADTIQHTHHWMCLHFEDSAQVPYSCYVVRTPPTPFILMSGVRKKHFHCVMEALSMTLECTGWSEAQLSGHNMASLLDLLIHQHSQGPYVAYRKNKIDPNPLLAIAKRKRHCEECSDSNDTDIAKRVKLAEKAFGTDPPVLEKFTFKLKADDPDVIVCKVKLSGSHVLEGIKQCISLDYLSLPLPHSVANMHSFASNSVTIMDTSFSTTSTVGTEVT